jgi:hypothetical protein
MFGLTTARNPPAGKSAPATRIGDHCPSMIAMSIGPLTRNGSMSQSSLVAAYTSAETEIPTNVPTANGSWSHERGSTTITAGSGYNRGASNGAARPPGNIAYGFWPLKRKCAALHG